MNPAPRRRIAITGAAGNLGRRLRIHWWDRDDLELVLLDRDAGTDPAIVQADLARWDAGWVDCLSGVDTVVHLAANTDPHADSDALADSNIVAVRNLFRAAALKRVSRVILASSVWAMAARAGDSGAIHADEADPGDNAYGASKRFAENLAREQALSGGPTTIALRIGGCPPGANPPIRKSDWEDQCWLSGRDFCHGIDCAVAAPVEGFEVVNLTSVIPGGRWDLEHTRAVIGYSPKDRFDPPPPVRMVALRRAVRHVRRTFSAVRGSSSNVEVAPAARCQLGEAPLWDADRGSLWYVDIAGGQLHRHHPESGSSASFAVPEDPAFVVHDAPGGLLLGAGSTLYRFADDTLACVATLTLPPGARINDGCVDADGALWFGSMDRQGTEPSGRLHRYGAAGVVRHGRRCPIVNGPAFSPDGSWLYQVDTISGSIWRFRLQDGLPAGEGAPLISINPRDGAPDGLTVDAEGALWIALWGGWSVRRYSSEGELLLTVRFPCANVTKVAFGGPDLTTAYVTSASIGLSRQDRRAQPLAGAVFRFEVEVPGLPPGRGRI